MVRVVYEDDLELKLLKKNEQQPRQGVLQLLQLKALGIAGWVLRGLPESIATTPWRWLERWQSKRANTDHNTLTQPPCEQHSGASTHVLISLFRSPVQSLTNIVDGFKLVIKTYDNAFTWIIQPF